MSRNFIWVKSDTPPKCKLERWAKQALVFKASPFLAAGRDHGYGPKHLVQLNA